MRTRFIEVTNGNLNYGKFMLQQFTVEENSYRSKLPGYEDSTLRGACGWSSTSIWVLDLQTGEGARFECDGNAKLDLEKHRIWVCPMFEPFLAWLYEQDVEDIEALPGFLDLKDAQFAMFGHRREGPCQACSIEAEIGTEEVPHPIDGRIHTCIEKERCFFCRKDAVVKEGEEWKCLACGKNIGKAGAICHLCSALIPEDLGFCNDPHEVRWFCNEECHSTFYSD